MKGYLTLIPNTSVECVFSYSSPILFVLILEVGNGLDYAFAMHGLLLICIMPLDLISCLLNPKTHSIGLAIIRHMG